MANNTRGEGYKVKKGAMFKVFGSGWNEFFMTLEMYHTMLMVLGIVWLFLFAGMSLMYIGFGEIKLFVLYWLSLLTTSFGNGSITMPQSGGYTAAKVVSIIGSSIWSMTFKFLIVALLAGQVFWIFVPVVRYLKKKGEESQEDIWLAGAKYSTEDEVNEMMKRDKKRVDIQVGSIGIPFDYEPSHCIVLGQTGTGKTVLIAPLIAMLLKRRNKFAVHDTKGDFISKLHNPEITLIFNPLDERHMQPFGGWSVFNEIKTMMDIYTVANSIIPKGTGREVFFNSGAQDILAGLLFHCYFTGKKTNRDIWNVISLPGVEQAALLKVTKGGERGYGYLANPDSPMAASVRAVMLQFCKVFEYMCSSDGSFCIGDWVKDENPKYQGIFVSNKQQISETLRPILSLFFDIMAIRLLDLEDDDSRQKRTFMVLDEMNSLQQLSSLISFVTLARSKGGCMFGSFQTVSQIEKNYGKEDCDTIIDNCKVTVTLRVGSPNTAEFLSKKIGDVKKVKVSTSTVMKTGTDGEGVTLSESEVTERLIMPSTIQNLPDLTCYLHMPGYNVTQTKLVPQSFHKQHDSFIMRPGLSLDEIKAAQDQLARDTGALKTLVVSELEKEVSLKGGELEEDINPVKVDEQETPKQQVQLIDDDIINQMYR